MAKDPNRPLDYLVLPVAALRAATGGLPAETLGILLQLLIRAACDLTGGRIDNAAATTNAPQCNIPGLWHWEGHALVLDIYPADYEAKALSKRYSYAAAAGARWGKPHPVQKTTECNCIQTTMQLHAENDAIASDLMQLHEKTCNCMQNSMQLHPCAPARDVNHNFNIKGVVASTSIESPTVCETTANLPPPPPDQNKKFHQWWRLIAATHPTGKHLHTLPYDILCAAWAAYQCLPGIIDLAPLLQAYMADRLQHNKYGQRFYRASGIAKYFTNLADHITHAQRWAAETGYHRKQAAKAPPKAKPAPPPDPADTITQTDIQNFFQSIRNNEPVHKTDPADTTAPAEPAPEAPETPTRLG